MAWITRQKNERRESMLEIIVYIVCHEPIVEIEKRRHNRERNLERYEDKSIISPLSSLEIRPCSSTASRIRFWRRSAWRESTSSLRVVT